MKRKNLKHTKELLEPIIRDSRSYAECLKTLGLKATGGNYKHLQRNIDKFDLDCSHMLHQASNQGQEFIPFEELKTNHRIKLRLIKYRGHICEECKLSKWNDKPITLELHHIDGSNRNNHKDNLQILCPNCHSQTDNWRC